MEKELLKESEFITMKETATILNIGLSTLYHLIETAELSAYRFAKNTIRISKSELKEYIAKKKGGNQSKV